MNTAPAHKARALALIALALAAIAVVGVVVMAGESVAQHQQYPVVITWANDVSQPVPVEMIPDMRFSKRAPLETNAVVCVSKFIAKDGANEKEYNVTDCRVSLPQDQGVITNKGERNRAVNICLQLSHISGTGTVQTALYLPPVGTNTTPGRRISNPLRIVVYTTYPPY